MITLLHASQYPSKFIAATQAHATVGDNGMLWWPCIQDNTGFMQFYKASYKLIKTSSMSLVTTEFL